MSGIFFDLPSVRFLERFRFLELMLQTFAASLFRSLSPPVCALRQVHSRYDEAEFPSASQSAWNEFDSALDESRATDGVPSLFGALRHRDPRASQNGLKSRRRVSTLATCLSTPPRAISSTCSMALATCITQR